MATLINSISFMNFYNYYGSYENNTYEFKSGINVVNADNNMGKSKFYNGILWLLEDKVYDSDNKIMEPVENAFFKMASGKAKNELESFNMGVKLIFSENSDLYTVSKSISFKKSAEKLILGEKQFEIFKSQNNRDIPIEDVVDKNNVLKKIIPMSLRNYALLQGESMERLVDLSSKDGLSSTIDTLAGISIIKEICEISKRLSASITAQYRSKTAAEAINNSREIAEQQNYEKTLKVIEQTKSRIEESQRELDAANAKKDELFSVLATATKRENLRVKIEQYKSDINKEIAKKYKLEKDITSQLFNEQNPWLLMGLYNELEIYDKLRSSHIVEVSKLKDNDALIIMLPEGSPDVSSLQRMLKNCKCEVCGQKAPKDSEAWNHIYHILNRPNATKVSTKNDLSAYWGLLQRNSSSYTQTIPNISNGIDNYLVKIEKQQEFIDKKQGELDDFIADFSNVGGNTNDSENDIEILEKYKLADKTITDKTKEIEIQKKTLETLQLSKSSYENKQNNKNPNSEIASYGKFSSLMNNIEDILNETKERVFDNILSSLQEEANIKYNSLTTGNMTSGGKLNFKKQLDGTIKVSIRDVNNGVITGLGTGFQRMKQLSIIMAIISSKIGGKRFDYPFISDAPFSEFGEKFILNFFNIAPKVFTQSIILVKDLYNPDDESFLNNLGKIILNKMKDGEIPGTFYVNVIENHADTTNLVTNHKCYKR